MLERDFTIVCDRGCDLPPVYLERAQATVLEGVPHDALGHVDEVALKQEFIRLYRALAAQGHTKIASVHSCASFSPAVTCAREAAAACSGVADVRVIDSGSASVATGMVFFRLTCHWADGVPFEQAVKPATLTPAEAIGLEGEIGSIEPGKRADLVVLDKDLEIVAVYHEN